MNDKLLILRESCESFDYQLQILSVMVPFVYVNKRYINSLNHRLQQKKYFIGNI